MLIILVVLAFLINYHVSQACFITNCPPGGKRSSHDFDEHIMRECLRCGPDNRGHCVSPDICCGSEFGCLINNHYSLPCRAENFIPSPCKVPGKRCSSNDGVCSANGLCCSSEGCFHDSSCDSGDSSSRETQRIFTPTGRVLN